MSELAYTRLKTIQTHEDQGGVQILVILLHELLVIFFRLLAVGLKEPSPVILLSGWYVLFPVV